MKRYFCDCCGVEVDRLNTIQIPCHIHGMSHGKSIGYVDNDLNRVSGRTDAIEVCNKCSNLLYTAMTTKLIELQNQIGSETDD